MSHLETPSHEHFPPQKIERKAGAATMQEIDDPCNEFGVATDES